MITLNNCIEVMKTKKTISKVTSSIKKRLKKVWKICITKIRHEIVKSHSSFKAVLWQWPMAPNFCFWVTRESWLFS